jgi:hypothetical protein
MIVGPRRNLREIRSASMTVDVYVTITRNVSVGSALLSLPRMS